MNRRVVNYKLDEYWMKIRRYFARPFHFAHSYCAPSDEWVPFAASISAPVENARFENHELSPVRVDPY